MRSTAQYEFLDVIQAGEQFKISLVLDEYGNQAVCKAQINPADEFTTRQLGTQAAFLRDSNHPSIVNFRDSTETELFMEAMAGALETQTANNAKRFSAGEIVSFLRQMLTLLSHLDSQGLTAGQLSPRTIFCDENFSIFKISNAYLKDAAIPADPDEKIFPPEINSGDNYDVHASDIYCLGMTCIELALGAANFEAQFNGMYDDSSDLWVRWHENLHEQLPDLDETLDGFPTGLTEILQKMIAKPLELRFASADEVLDELNKIGVVDGKAVIKPKRKMPMAAITSCMIALTIAMVGWNVLHRPDKPEEPKTEVVEVIPTPIELVYTSNIPIRYKIGTADETEMGKNGSIKIFESEELRVWPATRQKGWTVSVDDKPSNCTKSGVEIDWKKSGAELTLDFERQVTLDSDYENFVWSFDPSVDGSFRTKTVVVNDLKTKEIWIKSNDSNVKLKNAKSNGWSSVSIPNEDDLTLNFVFPVQLELTGYKKLSPELLEDLNVKVGRHKLKFDQTRFFEADIPYTDKQKVGWETTVRHAGEKLFSQDWSNFSTESEIRKIAKLFGKVNIETEDGYTLQSVNGETGFGHFSNEVSVPFGENLDIVVSDSSGVIQLRDSVDWQKQFMFKVGKLMRIKELRSDNGFATFWLFRRDNPGKRKKISVSRFAQLPKEVDSYRVAVEWASGHRREFSLQEFMSKRKPIELGNANQVTERSRSSDTELYAGN
ncbi:hypothetical protein N9Y42_03070 [Mariniblastus sp.]|nr:hypothetical protein [Mariniblastus sp.]